jgi:hypothetical protein
MKISTGRLLGMGLTVGDCSVLRTVESGACINEMVANMDMSSVIVVFLVEKMATTMPYIPEK